MAPSNHTHTHTHTHSVAGSLRRALVSTHAHHTPMQAIDRTPMQTRDRTVAGSLRRSVAFQWFLTAFSVRPGIVFAISAQRLPRQRCPSINRRSSAGVHASRRMSCRVVVVCVCVCVSGGVGHAAAAAAARLNAAVGGALGACT